VGVCGDGGEGVDITQRDSSASPDEIGQGVMCDHVYGLRVGGSVTERLHHQIRREAQTSKVLLFHEREG
jgi:hypothetical protein